MPGTSFESDSEDFDSQDQSEAFDEDNTSGDDTLSTELRTFEELPQVEDLTRADGDREDDEALALDADEFDPDAIGDADLEEDDELDYRAATAEREDEIDGLGPDDSFDEARILKTEIDGLEEVRDAAEAEGGEDDVTDFQSKSVSDADLRRMGYAK
ncbi:MAG: hypothetical protein AB1942_15485 [Pseudomonadota bacterium]